MNSEGIPLLEGWLALEREDYVTAAHEYADAAKSNPSDYRAVTGWGESLYFQGRFSEALLVYQKSLRLNDANPTALLGTVLCHCEVGDYERAIQEAKKAIQQFPDFIDPYICLAYSYKKSMNIEAALSVLNTVSQSRPKNCNVYIELGKIHSERKEYKVAQENFTRALALSPKSADATLALGDLYLRKKDYRAARETFLKCVSIRPNWPDAHLGLGIAEMHLRKYDQAQTSLSKVLEAKPGMDQASKLLVRVYLYTFCWKKAWTLILQMAQARVEQKERLAGAEK
jgi:tetratricopeptide (TPR) repeat protein